MNSIQRAVNILGGPSKAALVLDVSVQAVCFWRDGQRNFDDDTCVKIERATDGAVTCEELHGDTQWVRIPDPAWPHPQGRPLVDHAKKAA